MLKCYNLSEADLTAVCSFQSILTRTGAVYRGLNSPHPNPSAENKLHIYRRIKRWNGTFPTTARPKYDRHKKMTPTWQLWPKGVIWWHQRCCQRHCFAQNVSVSSGSLWGKLLWPSKGGGLESWRRFSGVLLPVKAPQSGSKFCQILVQRVSDR